MYMRTYQYVGVCMHVCSLYAYVYSTRVHMHVRGLHACVGVCISACLHVMRSMAPCESHVYTHVHTYTYI